MKIKQILTICMCIFCGALFSCKETVVEDDSVKATEYYPLAIGKYVIYDVDSIIYNETIDDDTTRWQIKEMLADTFYDDAQRLNYRIERYRRLADTLSWELEYIWSVLDNGGNIEKTENNLKFVRLVSPVMLNKTWDGTIYLGDLDTIPVERDCDNLKFLEDWTYEYISTETPMTINSLSFENTLTVKQQGADNLLELNYATEVYAKGIGLVRKEFYHYTSQILEDIDWELKIECGYEVIMNVVEYN